MRVVLLLLLANVFVHAFVPGLHESTPIRKANWLLPSNGKTKVIKNNTRIMLMGEEMLFPLSNVELLSLLCNVDWIIVLDTLEL